MPRRLATALVVSLALPAAARAQIPDTFENLQLLPDDIDRARLIGTMRGWAGGLGVRCNYCHVGPDNLVGADFASDDKPAKRTARKMLVMARAINRELLADLPTLADGESHQVVSCYSCHRGAVKPPRNLRVELGGIYQSEGIDAALSAYRELREQHFAAGRYDFSEAGLVGLGRDLTGAGSPMDAVALLEMGLEFYPDSADLHASIAMAYTSAGRLDEAQRALDAALAIDPDNGNAGFAKQQLERARNP